MPRIPKRRAKGQYRERDETSPNPELIATDSRQAMDTLVTADGDEVSLLMLAVHYGSPMASCHIGFESLVCFMGLIFALLA